MVETMLDFMLGPMRGISHFYFEHQMLFNMIIVGLALYKLFFTKKNKANESTNY
ncbi:MULTISPECIES: hypothetical protein [Oceanobacillus]|uniref:Uncharacterized protein n=1 Tax=Oceanobacillus indicireducens TaxID=1004261 RepID=A0A917XZ56_9BACI|nr:hypothetical protein [Oceanobacillus indicireducens]GGN59020.1 hypothetical protein GCM10007971_21710 [Oceanobacillus indicireducens]